jgi:tRNA G18 (ribose-2'-O)-methylase SpoU
LADGFGIHKIYLVGYTPTPEHPAVVKTAMGSTGDTPWEHWESLQELMNKLKAEGYSVWAVETTPESQELGSAILPSPMAVIFGNERFGLDPQTLNSCDGTLRIPLRGAKNSMNVANCLGIVAYEWCRQHAN